MQLAPVGTANIGTKIFPKWTAAATLVKDNGVDGVSWATKAVQAKAMSERLDHAVRAMTSLDHAIDATKNLPVSWLVKGVGAYYRGYEAAKQAVTVLVASGLIPGAREKVGLQTMLAARDEFLRGVAASSANTSKYGGYVAGGWMSASTEDALAGLVMLRDQAVARPLMSGLEQVRAQVAKRRGVDPKLAADVTALFDRATGSLAEQVARAVDGPAPVDPAALAALDARTAGLLTQARDTAAQLVHDVPKLADIDRIAAAG